MLDESLCPIFRRKIEPIEIILLHEAWFTVEGKLKNIDYCQRTIFNQLKEKVNSIDKLEKTIDALEKTNFSKTKMERLVISFECCHGTINLIYYV